MQLKDRVRTHDNFIKKNIKHTFIDKTFHLYVWLLNIKSWPLMCRYSGLHSSGVKLFITFSNLLAGFCSHSATRTFIIVSPRLDVLYWIRETTQHHRACQAERGAGLWKVLKDVWICADVDYFKTFVHSCAQRTECVHLWQNWWVRGSHILFPMGPPGGLIWQ